MTITRMNVSNITTSAIEALQKVAAEYGLAVAQDGGARYSSDTLTVRFRFDAVVEGGEGEPSEPVSFARDAAAVGLEPGAYGQEFTYRGQKYTVIGVNLRARAYPVRATAAHGGTYKFDVEFVNRALSE